MCIQRSVGYQCIICPDAVQYIGEFCTDQITVCFFVAVPQGIFRYTKTIHSVNNIMLYLWSDSLLQFQCFFDRRDDSTPNKFTQLTVLSSVSKVGL